MLMPVQTFYPHSGVSTSKQDRKVKGSPEGDLVVMLMQISYTTSVEQAALR